MSAMERLLTVPSEFTAEATLTKPLEVEDVRQRTHELGMRMALGAPRRAIAQLVLGHGMLLAGIGVALGLAGALALTRLMTAMLFGVSPTDGLTYAAVSALLVITVFAACFVPARRAARVDPLEALRAQ